MGDAFLRALSADLTQTQRAVAPLCLFCVPQPRSLLSDEAPSQDVLYTHFLTPDDALERRLGAYKTLNGKQVAVLGSHIHTGNGFKDRRQVRILLSEKREICNQEVTVLHISRPLVGGIQVPEDLSEIDVATFRKYTAILRSFPENELVFYQLDETISQVHKICVQEQVYERYRQTLPANLREEWEAAVEELIHAGSFDDVEEDYRLQRRHGGGVSHLLQIQQVVECYLMESLHDLVFPRVVVSCQEQDRKLQQVMYRMRHYTPEDFGLRKEFHCFAAEARDTLITVIEKKTPLDMLLVFKACIDRVNDAITQNVKLRRLAFEAYQLTTDDILDQLLYVLVQAFNQVMRRSAGGASTFPIAAVIKYISDYHFINSNTTALGFTIANFQVAIEYFLMRGDHEDDCNNCADLALQGGNTGIRCSQIIEESKCVQAAHRIRRDLLKALESVELARRDTGTDTGQESPHTLHTTEPANAASGDGAPLKQLSVIGEWSSSAEEDEKVESTSDTTWSGSNAVHPVEFVVDEKQTLVNNSNVVQVSGGQRFFAAVTDDGNLFTWGDRSGGRLGYAIADGESRRVTCPQRVFALEQQTIVQVACGAFHTLVTDLNGHVFAWGSSSRGQLGSGTSSTAIETPSVVTDLRGTYMSSVTCGDYHSLALSSDGRVFSWGCNKYGKLGRPAKDMQDMAQPRQLGADWTGWALDLKSRIGDGETSVVRRIAAGKDHSLAVCSDGAVFTWGRGDSGQLGHDCYMDVSEPKQVMAISAAISDTCGLIDIAGGNDFSLFLLQNGTAYICGRDPSLEADKLHLSPTLLTLPSTLEREFFGQIAAVSCGEVHYALLAKSGALLQSYATFSQPSADAGSTTAEVQERRVTWLKEAGKVRRMVCGASHTLVVV